MQKVDEELWLVVVHVYAPVLFLGIELLASANEEAISLGKLMGSQMLPVLLACFAPCINIIACYIGPGNETSVCMGSSCCCQCADGVCGAVKSKLSTYKPQSAFCSPL